MKERAVGCLGWITVMSGVAGLVAVTIWAFQDPEGAAGPIGYVAAAGIGLAFGVALAVGGAWIGSGQLRLPMLGPAVVIVAVVSSAVILWVYSMLFEQYGTNRWVGGGLCTAMVVLVIVAAVVHQIGWSRRAATGLAARRRVPIDKLRHGKVQKVVGQVKAGAETLRAPLTGQDCVLWSVDALGAGGAGPGVTPTRQKSTDFHVEDATGRIRVRPARFTLTLRHEDQYLGAIDPSSAFARELSGDLALDAVQGRELILRPGALVAILGECRMQDGEWLLQPGPDDPLLISTRPEATGS